MTISNELIAKKLRRLADTDSKPFDVSNRIRGVMLDAATHIERLARELDRARTESFRAGAAPIDDLNEHIEGLKARDAEHVDQRERARDLAARLEAELALAEARADMNARQALIACASLIDRELLTPSSPRPMEKISLQLHTIAADAKTALAFIAPAPSQTQARS